MRRTTDLARTSAVIFAMLLFSGCKTVTPAPGSDKVHVTKNPADVAACKPLGNIAVPKSLSDTGGPGAEVTDFRNRTIGLGGNTALITSTMPLEGIAYHCE
jgi:hypothetical protein